MYSHLKNLSQIIVPLTGIITFCLKPILFLTFQYDLNIFGQTHYHPSKPTV